jgi:hypothetical protein
VVVIGAARFVDDRLKALNAIRRQCEGRLRPRSRDAARLARARFVRIDPVEMTGRASV